MLFHYLKLAIRLLIRNPFFTFINVLGLSVGFSAFIGLWQYASTELRSDHYHADHDRIARLCVDWRWTDDGANWDRMTFGWFPAAMLQQIELDFPEIESIVRILPQQHFSDELVEHGNQIVLSRQSDVDQKELYQETRAVYADPNLFEFFSIPLTHGDKATVLRNANAVVLSEKLARKYFGSVNPTGTLLLMNNQVLLKVTGVFEDLPGNTHLNFDLVISNVQHVNKWNSQVWTAAYGYVKFNRPHELGEFIQKVIPHNHQYWEKPLRPLPNTRAQISVQPLPEIPFSRGFTGDYFEPKSKPVLKIFSLVGLVILLMAWVNYINLTLARTKKRMKEVATRKIAGAGATDLLKQFLAESFLVNLISLCAALTILQVIRIPAQSWLRLTAPNWDTVTFPSVLFFLVVMLAGAIITGSYPAFMSLRYNPRVLLLMGPRRGSHWSTGLLSIFQYACAVVLIIGTLIIGHQIEFILNKGVGIFQDLVGIVESPTIQTADLNQKMENLRRRFLENANVQDAVSSRSVPGHRGENIHIKKISSENFVGLDCHGGVGETYLSFYNIALLAGRNFIADDQSDAILLSRLAVERLGYREPEDAIGVRVMLQLSTDTIWSEAEIIGVIQDYRTGPYLNFRESNTQYSSGRGIILTYKNDLIPKFIPDRVAVKLKTTNMRKTISELEAIYKDIFPGNVFVFYFLDDYIANQYNGQKTARNQVMLFTVLALGIACLGLLGIISNKIVEKTKEIGIRKMLGARSFHIGMILLNTTGRQMIVSVLIGIPVAYYLTDEYLQIFSERITIEWWHLVFPVAVMLLIMLGTISSVLIKATRTNPVESIRYE